MAFFRGLRPEVYFHYVKLRRDKKTGKRLWAVTLITTLGIDQALGCGDQIESAYAYILKLENGAVDLTLNLLIDGCTVDFFSLIDDAKPVLHLERVDLAGFRVTRVKETAELWFAFELENTDALHAFMKNFAFTRVYAQFKPDQGLLPGLQLAAEGALPKKNKPKGRPG